VILAVAYACLLAFGLALQSLPPILSLVILDLQLTHTQAGLLMSLFSVPGMVLAIPAGAFADRWGGGRVGTVSLLLVIVGTAGLGITRSYVVAATARTVAGFGAATAAIVAARMLSQWFAGGGLGLAMGVYSTAMPVGTIICFNAFGHLGESLGWRTPMLSVAAVTVLVLIAFRRLYRPAPDAPAPACGQRGRGQSLVSCLLRVGPGMWLLGLCWMWFNAAVISFSTFAPDFLVSRGHGVAQAGTLVSLLMWGTLVLNPVVGRLVDTVGNHELFVGASGVLAAAGIYWAGSSSGVLLPMVVLAVAVGLAPAAVFSLPAALLEPGQRGLGYGILASASSTGMVLGPYAAGWMRETEGSYEPVFLLLSALAMLVTVTAVVLRARRTREGREVALQREPAR
jgi:MFS family permease